MKSLVYGGRAWRRWLEGLPRASTPRPQVLRAAEAIVRGVRRDGDRALVRFTARFDGVTLTPATLRVKPREIRTLAARADRKVVAALRQMGRRILSGATRRDR